MKQLKRSSLKPLLFITLFFLVLLIYTSNSFSLFFIGLIAFLLLIILFVTSQFIKPFIKFQRLTFLIFVISVTAITIGTYFLRLQRDLNLQNAEELITSIEEFKNLYNRYPSREEINIPLAYNGLNTKHLDYFFLENDLESYYIRYVNDIFSESVYVSSEKKWYIDD